MDKFKSGDWKALCDICGFHYLASELRESGQFPGLMVCKKDYDPRHPQERVRGRADDQTVPWTRPRAELNFIDNVTLKPEDL